jgi:hypothetical protein
VGENAQMRDGFNHAFRLDRSGPEGKSPGYRPLFTG